MRFLSQDVEEGTALFAAELPVSVAMSSGCYRFDLFTAPLTFGELPEVESPKKSKKLEVTRKIGTGKASGLACACGQALRTALR